MIYFYFCKGMDFNTILQMFCRKSIKINAIFFNPIICPLQGRVIGASPYVRLYCPFRAC
jgi:hypothetical protein